MKRPLTLISAILGTVVYSILIISAIITLSSYIKYFDGVLMHANQIREFELMIGILIFVLTFVIVGLILSIFSIVAWDKSKEQYQNRRGGIITAIVFNFIMIITIIAGFSLSGFSFLSFIELMILLASAIMFIVDLSIEKNRVEKISVKNVENNKTELKLNTTFDEKLIKINKLKEQGIINEKEYSELKKKIINEDL